MEKSSILLELDKTSPILQVAFDTSRGHRFDPKKKGTLELQMKPQILN